MTDPVAARLSDSARRLRWFLTNAAPPQIVRQEVRLLIGFAAQLYGPVPVRTWVDEIVTRLAAELTCPGGEDCQKCAGIGRTFTADGTDPQCPACAGTGTVPSASPPGA